MILKLEDKKTATNDYDVIFYWICGFHYYFLPVSSLETSVCSTLKFCPVFFWGHNEYKIVFPIESYIVNFRPVKQEKRSPG